MSDKPISCIIIGEGTLAVRCAEELLSRGHSIATMVTAHPDLLRWAEGRDVPVLPPGKGLSERLGDLEVDWLFSIANLRLIGEDVLGRARRGAINFHDGPLPEYAGLNVPVWAVANGEARHGVSWHLIEGGIDEGDLVAEARFDLDPRETALTLNTRCYEAGAASFIEVLDGIAAPELPRRVQDLSKRRYFGRHDRPVPASLLDLEQGADAVDAVVRSLDHGAYPNPVGVPKVFLGKLPIVVGGSSVVDAPRAGAPGEVLAVDASGVTVATGDGAVRLERLRHVDGREVAPKELEPGASLAAPADFRERLAAVDGELAAQEPFWARRLRSLQPARLPAATGEGPGERARRVLAIPAHPAGALGTISAWLARTTQQERFDFGHRHPALGAAVDGVSALYATEVPLRVRVDRAASFTSLTENTEAVLGKVAERGSFLRDLVLRQGAPCPFDPDVAFHLVSSVEEGATAAPMAVLTDGTEVVLDYDEGRVDGERIATQLEVLAEAAAKDPTAPVGSLPLLSEADRARILGEWNATAREVVPEGIHALFEAQVDRTPEAPAVTFADGRTSYAELDARANRLARRLQAVGVGPDATVALFLPRTTDLIVAALGILKAGAAYVPLDPAYPADRIAYMLGDSGARIVVTDSAAVGSLPPTDATVVEIDGAEVAAMASDRPPAPDGWTPSSLAYVIYTSGSTGAPKGVMVEHRQVVNFFAGMDDRIPHAPGDRWLAVTSLSFDISVLELFWTLSRGLHVILAGDEDRTAVSGTSPIQRTSDRHIDFSLFFFASDGSDAPERKAALYDLLMDGARFADTHGFHAVWTPERHFHAFGGLFPNPSVASAAIAAITENVKIRAGSCVSPLHHPVRVAEEWALVDNLSKGRVGISFAAGWAPNDFLLRPTSFGRQKEQMFEDIDVIRRLWRGETVTFDGPKGPVEVQTLPRPLQEELPILITTAGNPKTFEMAGTLGAGILTHMLGQSIDDVRAKIQVYREAYRAAGHAGDGHVVLMLHTFIGEDDDEVREIVREPMKSYLKSSLQLIKNDAWAFPAFTAAADENKSFEDNFASLSEEDTDALLEHSFARYYETSGLFGTPESARRMVEACRSIGVDEIGCLVDFGVDPAAVKESFPRLDAVRAWAQAPVDGESTLDEADFSLAAQLQRHRVTHMQCTPSMARMLVANDAARAALAGLEQLMVGGEALPSDLAKALREASGARLQNMYGPTETTIWSSTSTVDEGPITLGTPIVNTFLYVLDPDGQLLPPGVPGELFIGGDGVTRGYWNRPELTAERFVADPHAGEGARMYRTGDLVAWRDDGTLRFLGRLDHQVKVRGHRIELGEIEACMADHPGIASAVAIAREDVPGDVRLVGYYVASGEVTREGLASHLADRLPTFMRPAHLVALDRFPLTPNRKVDRKRLPRPDRAERRTAPAIRPAGATQETLAEIWRRLLGVAAVGVEENFFDLGGHSLLAVQLHREVGEATGKKLTVTDVFRFPTIASLASHLDGGSEGDDALAAAAERAAARRKAGGKRRTLRRR
jgi:natural product biosynthesis luciferase-like monooxygenase protein